MKFLITTDAPPFGILTSSSAHIHSCPSDSDLSIPLSSPETVDVWICSGSEVTKDLLDLWLSKTTSVTKSIFVGDAGLIPRVQEYAANHTVEVAGFPEQNGATTEQWEESILRKAELTYARLCAKAAGAQQSSNAKNLKSRKQTVVLVGAGIINLITAEYLAVRGYQVRVVDAGPNPRSCKDWTQLGVTNGGGNARMFTRTEADNYNEKGSKLYANMKSIFRKTTRNGGWSVKDPKEFTAVEEAWVHTFERIPPWMARLFRENIHEINMESGKLWNELIQSAPEIFQDVGFYKDIVRLYVEPDALEAAVTLHNQLGAIIKAESPEKFLTDFPGFRTAAESDHLAGGLIVDGFTVNIHTFVAKLMDRITSLGGEFLWSCEATSIIRSEDGEVTGLDSQLGVLEADHYVLSPGVTGEKLLKGTRSEGLIQGVLGIWLQIPNLHPQMQNSMKIHRRGHLVEDINVTVAKDAETGEDILMFGGGYGYVGQDRPAHDNPDLLALYGELEEVARIYFPEGYAAAKASGGPTMYPGGHRKFCVRPFTTTGLGVFEQIPTVSGGQLIITGGNNTGGFAQAPALARAVLRAFDGEHDPIHEFFHPDRGRLPAVVPTYKSRFPGPLSLRSVSEIKQPLRLLLLCSDGPNHRYLRYRLDQAFPGYRCIQETTDGQVRKLVEKRRLVDAAYMKYHSMRREWTGHNVQRKAYFDNLVPQDHASPTPDLVVDSVNCRDVWKAVEEWKPELTIVSGTKFIGKKLIERAGLMINLHIGHLPEYKGNHCIFFALYDGEVSKVSATLHQLTSTLDGGDVLDRVAPVVSPSDTEETLYTRAAHMAIDQCVKHIEDFQSGESLRFVPQENKGETYRHRDRTPAKEMYLWWRMRFGGLLTETQSKMD